MKLKSLFLALLLALPITESLADSPLTSTNFWTAYKDVKTVIHIQENGLDKKGLKMLGSKKVSSLDKISAINSLGFNHKKTSSFEAYLLDKRKGLTADVFEFLKTQTEGTPVENEQTKLLTADDLVCWAYLNAMDDYNHPNLSMRAAFFAFMRDTKNMAYGTIAGLISSQKAFDYDWCSVYKISKELIQDTEYENNILSDEAEKIIMDYISLYKDDCKK